jgi:hypothetical protein
MGWTGLILRLPAVRAGTSSGVERHFHDVSAETSFGRIFAFLRVFGDGHLSRF